MVFTSTIGACSVLQVVTSRALGRPAYSPSRPAPPSPSPAHPSPAPPPVGSSCVAASNIVVSTNHATHGALHVNVVRDVVVHAERDARAISGTPTSPSRIDQVSITVRCNVVVVAEAERERDVATTTLVPCLEQGVEAVGAAAEVEAAGISAAPTASRVPFPGVLLQEAGSPPQAPHASSIPHLTLFILCILLLVLLAWRLLGDEAFAEAMNWQVMWTSMRAQVGSLVPVARGGAPMSRAAVPAARQSSARAAAEGRPPEPSVEAHPDSVGSV